MLIIRKMESAEAPYVKKIAQKAFDGIERFFVSTPKEAMVAVTDDHIVGGIIIKYITCKEEKTGYFDGAFIDPRYQGKGIGSTLYEKTTQYLWEQGCTSLSVIVKDDNVASWKLFLDNGFCSINPAEGIRQLGLAAMLRQYFSTPFFISNGMEYCLARKKREIKPKKTGSANQICLYILANILLFFFCLIQDPQKLPPVFRRLCGFIAGRRAFWLSGRAFIQTAMAFSIKQRWSLYVRFYQYHRRPLPYDRKLIPRAI